MSGAAISSVTMKIDDFAHVKQTRNTNHKTFLFPNKILNKLGLQTQNCEPTHTKHPNSVDNKQLVHS
jgi:hypothetical protein